MPFDNNIINMQTPGRLHALCKLLLLNSYTSEQLLELLQPDSDQVQSAGVLKLAKTGGIVVEVGEDKKLVLQVPKKDVDDPAKFQQFIANKTFQNPEYLFGKFTAWAMTRGEKLLKETDEDLAERFFDEVSRHYSKSQEYNKMNIVTWMVWANYLGLGHRMDRKFILNPAPRIKLILLNDTKLPKGEFIPFQTFMKLLGDKCPELDGGKLNIEFNDKFNTQKISFALSLALRTLHDLQIITLQHTRDVEDIWFLHEAPTHDIRDQVTDIMVKG